MPAGDQAARGLRGPAELDRPGQLGGTRRRLDDPACQGRLVLRRVGIALVALGMRADLVRGEVGAVPVDAGDPGAVLDVPVAATCSTASSIAASCAGVPVVVVGKIVVVPWRAWARLAMRTASGVPSM